MQLNLNHITYTYPGAAAPALADLSATFPAGWTGIIGDNGCGKTTLARIAAGFVKPDGGSVSPKLFGAFCPQDSSIEPEGLADFAADWSPEAIEARRQLDIDDSWLWDFAHLSGGQQKRVQIACALSHRPDLLVMDEPTNDLDAATREAVARALASFEGVGLLISHDRALLNRLVGQCLVFEGGSARMRPGGYDAVSSQAAADRAAAQRAREAARREAQRLAAEAARRSEEAARSKARLSASGIAPRDSDRRERLGRAKVTGKDAVAGHASAAFASRLARAEARADAIAVPKRYDSRIAAYGGAASVRAVAHCEAGAVPVGDGSLRVPELWVGPADHVGLTGRNGSGKTTLLRHLLASVPEGVRVAYVPQNVDDHTRERARAQLASLSAADAGRVLALVAGLNSDPDRLLDGADTSPGEMRKLMLAEQLLTEPHFLVLDEPTNHLDVGSIEALQAMLAAYPGALLLVSHDEQLVKACCLLRWHIEECAEREEREGNASVGRGSGIGKAGSEEPFFALKCFS